MIATANSILIVDDSHQYNDTITSIIKKGFPQFECDFAETIDAAYWKYVEHPEQYKLVLLDFNLEGNRSRSNFDGIDLALMIDTFSKRRGLETPWLVAFTSGADELLKCFFNLTTSARLMDVIEKKEGPTHVRAQLSALFAALQAGEPKAFRSGFRKPKRSAGPIVKYDDETLLELCQIYRNRGKEFFGTLATEISKKLFSSYYEVTFSVVAPGFSGSEILSVVAQRRRDFASDLRTFVVKVCEIDKNKKGRDKSEKLEAEADNYFRYAKDIRAYVPLLVGPFKIKDWRFIAYEFVSIEGYGVCTFADHLRNAIKEREGDSTSEIFKRRYSAPHSRFIFEKILKSWHESREHTDVPVDTRLIYDKESFRLVLDEVEKKITDIYENLGRSLRQEDTFLNLDLFAPQKLTLVNPLVVARGLLRQSGPSYYKHFLSSGRVHGDLHSGNILRSLIGSSGDPGEWILIDFANVAATHLSQDAARLECDLKIQQLESNRLQPRFALEVELARSLDLFLGQKLSEHMDTQLWKAEWMELPNKSKLIAQQILDIRDIAITRLEENRPDNSYSAEVDYTVALLMQSLMFVRYIRHPTRTPHAWLAACLAATLIYHYFTELRSRDLRNDVIGMTV